MGYIGQQITTVFPTSISVDSATISGNASIGGTLGVTGATTLSNQLTSTNFPNSTVIQTIVNTATTNVATTSTTAQDLISASITPQFTDSEIFIEGFVSRLEIVYGSSNAYASLYLQNPSDSNITTVVSGDAGDSNSSPAVIFGTHSPNSTSSQTYKMQFSKASSGTTSTSTDGQRYSIILREIRR